MSKLRSPSIIWLNGLAAHGRGDHVLHVGHADVPRGQRLAVDGKGEVRLAHDAEHAGVLDRRRICADRLQHLVGQRSSSSRSGPMIFTEFSPLTPESDSITLSRMFCEKFQSTPISVAVQLAVHLLDQLRLGAAAATGRAARGHCDCGFSGTKNSAL